MEVKALFDFTIEALEDEVELVGYDFGEFDALWLTIMSIAESGAPYVPHLILNDDTGNNYTWRGATFSPSAYTGTYNSGQNAAFDNYFALGPGMSDEHAYQECFIVKTPTNHMMYAETHTHHGSTTGDGTIIAGTWDSTDTIEKLTIKTDNGILVGDFDVGTHIQLHGITQ